MLTFAASRAALTDRLASIDGLNAYPGLPPTLIVPAAIVLPAVGTIVSYDTTMDGTDDLFLRVLLLVGRGEDVGAQELLDGYLARDGNQSIKAAVEPTLGGVAEMAVVTEAANWGLHEVAGASYFGCELSVMLAVDA